MLRTASCPAKLAGPIALRSTQFGVGISRILRVLRREQWVEDFRYVALDAMDRHHVVYLTVLQRHWRLPLQHRMGMQGVNGTAARSGKGRPDHLH